jgi:hypothetical protein
MGSDGTASLVSPACTVPGLLCPRYSSLSMLNSSLCGMYSHSITYTQNSLCHMQRQLQRERERGSDAAPPPRSLDWYIMHNQRAAANRHVLPACAPVLCTQCMRAQKSARPQPAGTLDSPCTRWPRSSAVTCACCRVSAAGQVLHMMRCLSHSSSTCNIILHTG